MGNAQKLLTFERNFFFGLISTTKQVSNNSFFIYPFCYVIMINFHFYY